MKNKDKPKSKKKLSPKEMIKEKSKERENKNPTSFSDMKQMIADTEARFIRPTPRDELGGVLGITLQDIATSLGVSHKDLRRKLEKPENNDLDFITSRNYLIRKVFLIPAAGARTHSYVMDIRAAQFVVSSYNNFAGRTYRDYLLRTNEAFKVSLNQLEEQEKEIADLKKDLERLQSSGYKPKKSQRKEAVCELTVSQTTETSLLFGNLQVAKTIKKTLADMTPEERNLYDLQQGIRKSLGMLKKCRDRISLILAADDELVSYGNFIVDYLSNLDKLVNKTGLKKVQINNDHPKSLRIGGYVQESLFKNEDPKKVN